MGYFLAITAFQADSPNMVINACVDYLKAYGIGAEVLPATVPFNEETDAKVFAPKSGWCVILWPSYFNTNDFPLVRTVCSKAGLTASTVHVYDSDYWEHLFCIGPDELHQYCSRPHYWAGEADSEVELRLAYNSNPSKLCKALDIDTSNIQPYLIDTDDRETWGKAFEDDEFELYDFWVFVDFWRRMGITFPPQFDKDIASVIRITGDFMTTLPAT